MRVLMLGPVGAAVAVPVAARRRTCAAPGLLLSIHHGSSLPASGGLSLKPRLGAIVTAAKVLTVISMAARGLGVDLRVVGRVGGRVTVAVVVSLLVLIVISIALIRLLRIA